MEKPPSLRRRSRGGPGWLNRPRRLWGALTRRIDPRLLAAAGAALVLVLALGLPTVLGSATITLAVAATRLQTNLTMTGTPGNYDGTFETFNTRTLSSTQTDSASGTSSGQQAVAAIPATGEVVFTDALCASPTTVPAGTTVTTADGHQFLTEQDVSLCAGSASATVQVKAATPGNGGNVNAYSITQIPSPPAGVSGLTVTNPAPMAGGADARNAIVIQQSDVDTVRSRLIQELDGRARADLKAQASRWGYKLIASSYPQLTSQLDNAVGTEAQNFQLTLTETLKGVAYSDKDVHARLRMAIRVRVPPGQALTGDPIKTWYDVTAADESGTVRLDGHGQAYVMPVLDTSQVGRHLALNMRGGASGWLRSLPAVVGVQIDETPFPLPWLPAQPSHISIDVFEQGNVPTPVAGA